jgi:hypothetical protein
MRSIDGKVLLDTDTLSEILKGKNAAVAAPASACLTEHARKLANDMCTAANGLEYARARNAHQRSGIGDDELRILVPPPLRWQSRLGQRIRREARAPPDSARR